MPPPLAAALASAIAEHFGMADNDEHEFVSAVRPYHGLAPKTLAYADQTVC